MAAFEKVEKVESGNICVSDSLHYLRKKTEMNKHDSGNSFKLQKDMVEEQNEISAMHIKSSCNIAMGAITEGGDTKQTNESCSRQTSSHEDEQPGGQELSHAEMKEVFHRALSQLLAADPILNDLHPDITHEEVQGLLEVSCGLSMLVLVGRADGGQWQVRVPCDARLYQLKAALRTHVTLSMHRQGCRRPLSWRSVWRRHWLVLPESGERLKDDNATLNSLGVHHRSVLTFVKRDREKTRPRERRDV